MDQNIKISINIITKDRADLLPFAIDSVLNQTFQDWEIVIVDSGSTDKTQEIVRKYKADDPRIKYFLTSRDTPLTRARNKALELSSGKYIAVLDSDDLWISKEKLQKQFEFLENNSDHAVVGTLANIINVKDQKIGQIENYTDDAEIKQNILIKNQIVHSSVLISRKALEEVSGYDESVFIWEDYSTFLKIGRQHKIANLPEFYTAYRKHNSNISKLKKIKGYNTLFGIILKNVKYYPNSFLAIIKMLLRYFR